jgi:hypothetical protein
MLFVCSQFLDRYTEPAECAIYAKFKALLIIMNAKCILLKYEFNLFLINVLK